MIADPAQCAFQFNPVGTTKFIDSCDIAKSALAKAGLNYENVAAPAGTPAQIRVGNAVIDTYDGKASDAKEKAKAFDKRLATTLKSAGYPPKADPYVANQLADDGRDPGDPRDLRDDGVRADRGDAGRDVSDPDPLHIDVDALSHPQRLVRRLPAGDRVRDRGAAQGDIYSGLWYPIVIALATFVIGMLFVKETKDSEIYAQD